MRGTAGAVFAAWLAWGTLGAPPDAVYVGGNIYTMDPARPRASALAVEGDRIVAVGGDEAVRALAGPGTRRVELAGRTVLPGLIDAHGHVSGLGALQMGVLDLSRTRSFEEVVAAVSARVARAAPGEWILGRGWDHESWPSRTLPTHRELSAASPDNPVWLNRVDGHAGLANRKAMELAGVTADTANPAGGEVLRGARGEATGVFVDNAESIIDRMVPQGLLGRPEDAILAAQRQCLAAGLTSVHDAGVSPGLIGIYQRLESEHRLKLRVYAMMAGPYAMKWFEENDPIVGDRLTCRAAKLYIDGAMGSRGAWLLEPYADRPTGPDGRPYAGLAVGQPEFVEAVAGHALKRRYQVCTHAIGDRGNREVLDAYERALAQAHGTDFKMVQHWAQRPVKGVSEQAQNLERLSPVDPRFRIEHAQLLSPADIPRFAALGVIPSMQPTHCTSDMRWVDARVGPERAKGAYAWASLLRTGVRIAAGSDFPVESHNPFLGLYAAVTRQNADGEPAGGWHADERMTREEALRAFTLDAAYASFEEDAKGSLTPGKLADFIVIDRDVMTCPPGDIAATQVLVTVVGGETVFEAPQQPAVR